MFISVLVSWIQEWIASLFSWRSKNLVEAIQVLLDGEKSDLFKTKGFLGRKINSIAEGKVNKFYESGFVKSLAKKGEYPSYIDARDFASYIIDYILQADGITEEGKQDKKTPVAEQLKKIDEQVGSLP